MLISGTNSKICVIMFILSDALPWCRPVNWCVRPTWPRSGSGAKSPTSSTSCSWTRSPVSAIFAQLSSTQHSLFFPLRGYWTIYWWKRHPAIVCAAAAARAAFCSRLSLFTSAAIKQTHAAFVRAVFLLMNCADQPCHPGSIVMPLVRVIAATCADWALA